eukprot:scaffold130405_cov18-Tisochrysis_lutea.AAC.1
MGSHLCKESVRTRAAAGLPASTAESAEIGASTRRPGVCGELSMSLRCDPSGPPHCRGHKATCCKRSSRPYSSACPSAPTKKQKKHQIQSQHGACST